MDNQLHRTTWCPHGAEMDYLTADFLDGITVTEWDGAEAAELIAMFFALGLA